MTFGELVRKERKNRKLSQEELAELAKVSTISIIRIESGQIRFPHKKTVRSIAQILELDVNLLIDMGLAHCFDEIILHQDILLRFGKTYSLAKMEQTDRKIIQLILSKYQ